MTARKAILAQRPSFMLEQEHGELACGIDEAGRGPLAGPVVAACVFIPEKKRNMSFLQQINDSKKLSAKKRAALFEDINAHCHFGVSIVSAEEIDELNIHHATLAAMGRAYEQLYKDFGIKPAHALIDGKFAPKIDCGCRPVTKGDSISLSIAAASILAKVTRDRIMARLHEEFPYYGWKRNAGYGTAEHLAGLKTYGVTPYHRRSYAPVRAAL